MAAARVEVAPWAVEVAEVPVNDEGHRFGIGRFKALGGSHAVIRLVPDEASHQLRRPVDLVELPSDEVRGVAATMAAPPTHVFDPEAHKGSLVRPPSKCTPATLRRHHERPGAAPR